MDVAELPEAEQCKDIIHCGGIQTTEIKGQHHTDQSGRHPLVIPTDSVTNFDVIADENLSMEKHIAPILKQPHWLPVEQRIIFKISMFVFKTIHGVSPSYLCSLVKPYEPLRGNMRCANKLLLTEHKSKNSWGARSFTISAAKAWNTLPNNISACATVCVFKTALKTHLFKPYYE